MSAAFVIDCTIAMTWCFPDEATPTTAQLQDRLKRESALVPALWYLEVANVLALAERRERITRSKSDDFITQLSKLDIEVEGDVGAGVFNRVLPLARSHRLTTYDATYIELALRRRLPLASLDGDVRQAASDLGVEVLGL